MFPADLCLNKVPADFQAMADRWALKGVHLLHRSPSYPLKESTHVYNCYRLRRALRD